MKLKTDRELENTRRKLKDLNALIHKKQGSAAHALSLETMRSRARRMEAEIAEYERAHQIA